jgi:hypothetical protein
VDKKGLLKTPDKPEFKDLKLRPPLNVKTFNGVKVKGLKALILY